MMSRRDAIAALGALSVGTVMPADRGPTVGPDAHRRTPQGDQTPPLAPGAPTSPERTALIDEFRRASNGLEAKFEARSHRSDWVMPYRLYRPEATGKLPLVLYLHGGGGLGDDNLKQIGVGNVFGTRVWALPASQHRFPCYVVAPQTDRGWVRYGPPASGGAEATVVAGFGEGARLALEIVDALRQELPIDERRIYLAGQSMGGGGAWHLAAQRPGYFAAAVICCGTATAEPPAAAVGTPVWNFHGDADEVVPVAGSRDRIAALRRAGGRPIGTEYPGVGHNVWQWAFTEPALLPWVFSHRLPG